MNELNNNLRCLILSDTKIEERVRVRFTTRKPKKTEEKREQRNRVLVQRKRILSEKNKRSVLPFHIHFYPIHKKKAALKGF